jgi:hypothetical protein
MHKNWRVICAMWDEDPEVMRFLARFNPTSPFADQVRAAFPVCFCEQKMQWPVPLTVLCDAAERGAEAQHDHAPRECREYLTSYGTLKEFGIPAFSFAVDERAAKGYGRPLLPQGIDPDAAFGSLVTWEGRAFMVVDTSSEILVLAPAECIVDDRNR